MSAHTARRASTRAILSSTCNHHPASLSLPASAISAQSRYIHDSRRAYATPIPHPPAPGPPPKPPMPSASFEGDRVARKRKQASLLELGKTLKANPAKPSSVLQKRFWKDVSVRRADDGSFEIHLDARPVRTPSKQALHIPASKPALAAAIAVEWDSLVSAQQALKTHYIPLTSLVARALDIEAADEAGNTEPRYALVRMLLAYLRTDTLLCWVPESGSGMADAAGSAVDNTRVASAMAEEAPLLKLRAEASAPSSSDAPEAAEETLRARQISVARPIMAHLERHAWRGATLRPALAENSISAIDQDEATRERVAAWLGGLSAWELAAVERATLAGKSLCVAARLVGQWSGVSGASDANGESAGVDALLSSDSTPGTRSGPFTVEHAAQAVTLEVSWQTGMWGEVEDTHDVEREDLRRQLGSAVLLVGPGL